MPPELVEALGLKSYVAFPLLAEARTLGLVLCSHTTAPRRWSNEERQLVEQLALEGSLVVENAALRATEQQRLDELSHQAFHDSLTELPNRALFADRLGLALARTERRKVAVAVLFLDLDDFKPINDRFGHDAGDRLLRAVAERVRACVRPEDTVARLGGDEFTILLEDIVDVRYAIGVAERIEEALREPFPIDGHEADRHGEHRDRRQQRPGRHARGPDAQLRPGDVPGQAQGSRATRAVCLYDQRPRDRSPAEVSEAKAEMEPRSRVEEQLAAEEELAGEAAVEDALVIEHAEAAPLDDGDDEEPAAAAVRRRPSLRRPSPGSPSRPSRSRQPRDEAREAPESDDALGSAAALTEARRRRRLRFPPRG